MSCMLKCPVSPIPVYSHTKMEQTTEKMFGSLLFAQYWVYVFKRAYESSHEIYGEFCINKLFDNNHKEIFVKTHFRTEMHEYELRDVSVLPEPNLIRWRTRIESTRVYSHLSDDALSLTDGLNSRDIVQFQQNEKAPEGRPVQISSCNIYIYIYKNNTTVTEDAR
jgi:hypothetical protein